MSDQGQFESFMQDYQDMVYTTALRLVGNEADAEDIAQETFLRAYAHFDELQHSPTAGGWLKTVARNLSLNHLTRYRTRWQFFSESTQDGHEEHDLTERISAPDPDDQAADLADKRTIIEDAIRALPPAQRAALVLYHFEDMSYEEIAANLKVSLGKVKTDIHRARESLRRKLGHRLAAGGF
jgi:RNA polymerase sigma-70 factor (ECF subfamily)